jgi:hypothetical protein
VLNPIYFGVKIIFPRYLYLPFCGFLFCWLRYWILNSICLGTNVSYITNKLLKCFCCTLVTENLSACASHKLKIFNRYIFLFSSKGSHDFNKTWPKLLFALTIYWNRELFFFCPLFGYIVVVHWWYGAKLVWRQFSFHTSYHFLDSFRIDFGNKCCCCMHAQGRIEVQIIVGGLIFFSL